MAHAPFPFDPRFEDSTSPYRSRLRGQPIDYATVIEPQYRGALELGVDDRRYVVDMYDAQVRRLDDYVGAFVDSLENALDGQPCVVFITSDHGEELLDHGLLGHGQSLFQELLAVPLIVHFPGQEAPDIDARPTSGLDLVPTILDLAGLPYRDLPGYSLCGRSEAGRLRIGSQSESVHALIASGRKFISGRVIGPRGLSPPVQLFDLEHDPGETVDLSPALPDTARHMAGLLARYMKKHRQRGEPAEPRTPGTPELRRLQALGYVLHDQPSTGLLPTPADSGAPARE
jgi:arylsulfatase A-like enzyme